MPRPKERGFSIMVYIQKTKQTKNIIECKIKHYRVPKVCCICHTKHIVECLGDGRHIHSFCRRHTHESKLIEVPMSKICPSCKGNGCDCCAEGLIIVFEEYYEF